MLTLLAATITVPNWLCWILGIVAVIGGIGFLFEMFVGWCLNN